MLKDISLDNISFKKKEKIVQMLNNIIQFASYNKNPVSFTRWISGQMARPAAYLSVLLFFLWKFIRERSLLVFSTKTKNRRTNEPFCLSTKKEKREINRATKDFLPRGKRNDRKLKSSRKCDKRNANDRYGTSLND